VWRVRSRFESDFKGKKPMLGLMLSLSLFVVSATPVEPPVAPSEFDWATAKAHYEAFLYRYFTEEWGAKPAKERFVETARKTLPTIDMPRWPIDPTHGVFANSPGQLRKFAWLAVGSSAWQKNRPDTENKEVTLGALAVMSYSFFDGFNEDVAPTYCAPVAKARDAFKGAAACYFVVKAEYQAPGFWVALREIDGRVVIAGVLEHKNALEAPENDSRLAPFLAAIEKELAPESQKPSKPKVP